MNETEERRCTMKSSFLNSRKEFLQEGIHRAMCYEMLSVDWKDNIECLTHIHSNIFSFFIIINKTQIQIKGLLNL